METRAIAKHLRISSKKARLVADLIRGLSVNEAEAQLRQVVRKASYLISKTLRSAVSNAEHNLGLHKDNLYIKKISINQGASLKRWMPRAFGRASPIKKRSSHIVIILDEIKPGHLKKVKKPEVALEESVQPKTSEIKEQAEEKTTTPVETIEKSPKDLRPKTRRKIAQPKEKTGPKKTTGAIRRFFTRKAI